MPDVLPPPDPVTKRLEVVQAVDLGVEEVEHREEVALVVEDGRCRQEEEALEDSQSDWKAANWPGPRSRSRRRIRPRAAPRR